VRVVVELRDHDGALVGVDTWGSVTGIGYSAADEVVTIDASNGSGLVRKQYFSGQYAAVVMLPAGGNDFTVPADARHIA
jgi:hypothetical protein